MSDIGSLDWLKYNALFSCRDENCACEMSFNADMLRLLNGEPICCECYEHNYVSFDESWCDLPPFKPFPIDTVEGLKSTLATAMKLLRDNKSNMRFDREMSQADHDVLREARKWR